MTCRRHIAMCAGAVLLTLSTTPAIALDQRVGQAWRCTGHQDGSDINYIIGKLETVSEVFDNIDEDRNVSLAHLHMWEAHELGLGRIIAHLPVQANLLGCAGQIYVGEDRALPDEFQSAYDIWAQSAKDGRVRWYTGDVDQVFRAMIEIVREP